MDTRYIFELPLKEAVELVWSLASTTERDDFRRALHSRVCDLEDALQMAQLG